MESLFVRLCFPSFFAFFLLFGSLAAQANGADTTDVAQSPENQNDSQKTKVDDSDIVNLAENSFCKGDVQRLCRDEFPLKKGANADVTANNSLNVLECFLNHPDEAISRDCHQVIWQFKKNITKDQRISDIALSQCSEDLNTGLKECRQLKSDPGHFISCVVENKDKVQNEVCKSFINKLAVVVFSDYRLTGQFAEACETDIQRLQCGYVNSNLNRGNSQGAAINCLTKKLQEEEQLRIGAQQAKDPEAQRKLKELVPINPKCAHQILRLMELQADDFHLDRPLFFACRLDREQFCHDTLSGNGRVYQCLLAHKMHEQMSPECKEQLTQREKAVQTDYKVDYGLGRTCQAEIQQYQCIPPSTETAEVGMSMVILCLEGVIHQKGLQKISQDCLRAMQYQRQAMMSDFNISPNIVVFCKADILENCKNVHPKGMIHCLMGVAQQQQKVGEGVQARLESKLSPDCGRELHQLLLTADVASNVHVDAVLYDACHNIIETTCARMPSTPQLMGCLLQNMHKQEMSDKCERHLLETHYFVTRDIRLDPEVFAACRDETFNMCNLKDDWIQKKSDQAPESGPLTFACLYRHAFELGIDNGKGMSKPCIDQLQATMHQRAIAMDLPPGVDVQCIHDLAYFCTDQGNKLAKGQEFICLQKNYAQLQDACKAAVQHFTQAIDKDIKLSVTYQNCAPMLEKFCHDRMNKDSTFDDAMDCLIPNKDDPAMAPKCKAEIDHYELVNIQEYQLNIRFKEACRNDVDTFCKDAKDFGEIVLCLSSRNREDIINDGAHSVSLACRRQLRSELLARSSHPELDPLIQHACKEDIDSKCPGGVSVENILECLRGKSKELSTSCHRVLFKIELAQAVDPRADSTLVKSCRRAIEKYCRDEEDDKVLPCLIDAKKNNLDMDPKCSKVILSRQVEAAKDIRLNPGLFKDCKQDAQKFCPSELHEILIREEESDKLEYKLINCLKAARKMKKQLTDSCGQRITTMSKEAAMYYKLDPHLAEVCAQDIQQGCKNVIDHDAAKGEVIECLKQLLKVGSIKNQECQSAILVFVAEGKADIHIDPILYSACQLDVQRLCHDIQPGEGRQFQCLVEEMEGGHNKLSTQCLNRLRERVNLLQYAAKISPPETVEELVESITESRAKYYLLAVLGGAVLAILVIGICCGRVTKRVRRELKNR